MLQFKQDNTAAVMILTLTEFVTLPQPGYLFVFTHVETKQIVYLSRSESDDESDYPIRYNQFTIDATEVFNDRPTGEWHYKVYEFETDPETATNILEEGKLILDRSSEFAYTQYDTSTSFKAYNG